MRSILKYLTIWSSTTASLTINCVRNIENLGPLQISERASVISYKQSRAERNGQHLINTSQTLSSSKGNDVNLNYTTNMNLCKVGTNSAIHHECRIYVSLT